MRSTVAYTLSLKDLCSAHTVWLYRLKLIWFVYGLGFVALGISNWNMIAQTEPPLRFVDRLIYWILFQMLASAGLLALGFGAGFGALLLLFVLLGKRYLGDYTITPDDDFLRAEAPSGRAEIKWSAVSRIHITRKYLLIDLGLSFLPIPRRAFLDDDDYRAFARLCQDKVRQSAHQDRSPAVGG